MKIQQPKTKLDLSPLRGPIIIYKGCQLSGRGIENGGKGVKGEVIWLYYIDTANYLVGEKEDVIFRCPGPEHPCNRDDTTETESVPVIEVIKKTVHSSLELLHEHRYLQS